MRVCRSLPNLHLGESFAIGLDDSGMDYVVFEIALWCESRVLRQLACLEFLLENDLRGVVIPCLLDGKPLHHIVEYDNGAAFPGVCLFHFLSAVQYGREARDYHRKNTHGDSELYQGVPLGVLVAQPAFCIWNVMVHGQSQVRRTTTIVEKI